MTLTTGQKLWIVPSHGAPREVEVGKVGRKWAYLIPAYFGRIDIETLCGDGAAFGARGHQCYRSREEWEEATSLYKAWEDFRRRMPWRLPDGITMEDLAKVRELLHMEAAQ